MNTFEVKKLLISKCSCGRLIYSGDTFSKTNNEYKCWDCLSGERK